MYFGTDGPENKEARTSPEVRASFIYIQMARRCRSVWLQRRALCVWRQPGVSRQPGSIRCPRV